eukprot:2501454-Rhodomonas_salina.1
MSRRPVARSATPALIATSRAGASDGGVWRREGVARMAGSRSARAAGPEAEGAAAASALGI